ncbi:MAG: MoaD/ThiS family protein [Planctomycetota bacterium]
MSVVLQLPSILESAVGADRVEVEGATVGAAFDAACEALPNLRRHLLEDDGTLKEHVLCLVNGTSLPRGGMRDHRLAVGDEILIHQAISGG